jgi:hypothetical protein
MQQTTKKPITLEDCALAWDDLRERGVKLVLPEPIDLSETESFRAPGFCDHNHYKNRFGDLYVACPGFASFLMEPPKDVDPNNFCNRQLFYGYNFESFAPVTSVNPQRFWLTDVKRDPGIVFNENDTKETILQKIKSHEGLSEYLNAFINWVNDFQGRIPPTKPSIIITLDDCLFCQDEYQKGNIILALPREISVYGIEPRSDPSFHDHDHYVNEHGALSVTCDYVAGFNMGRPLDLKPEEMRGTRRHDDYRVLLHTMMAKYNVKSRFFRYTAMGKKIKEEFEGKETSDEIREAIRTSNILSQLTQCFLDWVNEFGRQHGEKHLYVRSQKQHIAGLGYI